MYIHAREFTENTVSKSANNMSTKTAPVQPLPPQSPPNAPRRRITPADAESIAKLLTVCRMTETEACAHLGIKVQNWFNWKLVQNNARRNNEVLARVRAAHIQSCIENIQDGSVGAGNHKRADWRASDRLLGIMDPSRFGQQAQVASQQPSQAPTTVNVWIDLAYAKPETGQVVDVQAKQITDSAPSDKTVQK